MDVHSLPETTGQELDLPPVPFLTLYNTCGGSGVHVEMLPGVNIRATESPCVEGRVSVVLFTSFVGDFYALHVFSTSMCLDEKWQLPLTEISSDGTSKNQILEKKKKNTNVSVCNLNGIGFSIHQGGGLGHRWSYFQHGGSTKKRLGPCWYHMVGEEEPILRSVLHCQSSERIGNFRETL